MSCKHRPSRHRRPAAEGTGPLAASPPAVSGAQAPRLSLTDTELEAGQVIKSVAGGHIARALGASGPSSPLAGDGSGDLVKGVAYPAAAAGAFASWYPTGSYVPIPGLPIGPIYRSALGRLASGSALVADQWTNLIGISDGVGLDVLVSPPFQWSPP